MGGFRTVVLPWFFRSTRDEWVGFTPWFSRGFSGSRTADRGNRPESRRIRAHTGGTGDDGAIRDPDGGPTPVGTWRGRRSEIPDCGRELDVRDPKRLVVTKNCPNVNFEFYASRVLR